MKRLAVTFDMTSPSGHKSGDTRPLCF
uniref:Uncharacterized protein n=1 Tax=Anguilla anguilla TaxID=7936 RepID=A0A0E9Q446_ANGAN